MQISTFLLCLLFSLNLMADEPPRIVSAGGSITEILVELGAIEQIVAVDTSSTYPEAVKKLPHVGYFRQLAPEGVISTGATHLLVLEGAGPESGIAQIRQAGIDVTVYEQPNSTEGLANLIAQLGEKINQQKAASRLIQRVEKQLNSAIAATENQPQKSIAFFMAINDHGMMAAGSNTVPDLIVSLLGMTNPFHTVQGYKSVSPESFLVNPPDLILMPSHRTEGLSPDELCNKSLLKLWAKKYGCQIMVVDPLQFLGLTPRLPDAILQVSQRLKEQ